ncbi:hypothetical protein JCM8097_006147 [Rhodosporidiobolus ruineniae]
MSTSPSSSPPPPSHSHRSLSPTATRHNTHSPSPSPPISPSPTGSLTQQGFLVRALHPFSPSTLASQPGSGSNQQQQQQQQANSCLSFDAGDVIRCLNMDDSGWWDGELVASVEPDGMSRAGGRLRGWFPRNYVEVIEEGDLPPASPTPPPPPEQLSPEAHTLLSSIEQNVGLLENAVRAGRKGHYQPSTACVISSIRTVLSATSCLTRDSPVLRQHGSLSSARKKILSSLAQLVNQARKASAPSLPLPPGQADDGALAAQERQEADEMLSVARGTVECVRGFLVQAERKGVEVKLGLGASAPATGASLAPGGTGGGTGSGAGGGKDLRPAKSMGNLRDQRRPTLEALQLPVQAGAGETFSTPSSSFAADLAPSSSSATLTLRTPSALSLHLSHLHDSLLSTIAALIGHVHSHSRSSSPASSFAHLIDLTREGIERVRDCLVVVEKVAAEVVRREDARGGDGTKGEEMKVLAGARERLYEATTALVSAARVATSRRGGGGGSPGTSPAKLSPSKAREQDEDERKTLLAATTGVLRAGGDCVGAVKLVVSHLSSAGGGEPLELVLPRPKTSEELAEEAAAEGGDGFGSANGGGGAAGETDDEDAGSTSGRDEFADAPSSSDERPPLSAGAAAEGGGWDASPRRPRNPHTLSMLGRKATSLGNLRGRFEADLRLEEAVEEEGGEGDGAEDERSSGSTATAETARSDLHPPVPVVPVVPLQPHRSISPTVYKKGHDRVKTSSISLSPAHAKRASTSSSAAASQRAPSPSPSAASSAHRPPSPLAERHPAPAPASAPPHNPSSMPMSRAFSSGSGHSQRSARSARSAQSSSRATAASTTSTVGTAMTAETSPRNSFQSSGVGGGHKRSTRPSSGSAGGSVGRTSLGSVWEKSGADGAVTPPMPLQFPSTPSPALPSTPPSALSGGSAASSLALPPNRASTPDRERKNSTVPPVPASPSGRDRSNVPWFLEREYAPREISFNADGHVSGGTLPCLVERMTLHDTTIDAGFSNTFLLTFRMFTTPLELARLLFARFDLSPPTDPETGAPLSVDEMKQWTASKLTPIRLRIYNLFKTWVEGYWLHDPDREVVDQLLEWCRGRLRAAMPSASQRLVDLVNKRVLAAEREAAAARSSLEGDTFAPTNASTTSLVSQGSTGSPANLSMNGSSVSLALAPTISRGTLSDYRAASAGSGGGGGLLHRMQSTDGLRLKAGKPVVPFSSALSPTAEDAYSPTAAAAQGAPQPIATKGLLNALRPTLSGRSGSLPSVVDIDPLELARQLTIMESRVYCSIRPDELLGSSGGGGKVGAAGESKNANVRKMSALSTRLTGWIAETILGEQDQKRRTALVKYFVKLGERLLALANYNALFAVFTALNSSTIARLRKTWDGLAPKYKAVFEMLRKATDHARNYAEYRQKIRQAVPPCLPFVGLFLTDLIFIFEGNRAERPSPVDPSLRLINFDRYHKMARIVGELQRFQVPYHLVEVVEIQGYLAHALEGLAKGQDAQSLYRQSLLIEPRQPSGPSSSAASTHSAESRHHRFNWPG